MSVGRRIRDAVAGRRLAAATARDLLPPPPHAFAHFGERSVLVPPTRVHGPEHIWIGDRVTVLELGFLSAEPGTGAAGPRLVIGDGAKISQMVTIACVGSVEIGADVMVGAGSFVGDASHAYEDATQPIIAQGMTEPRPVRIGDGAFIGIRCVVLPGTTVGEGAFVGAGSVVAGDIPARTVAAGNPARVIRRYVDGAWERV